MYLWQLAKMESEVEAANLTEVLEEAANLTDWGDVTNVTESGSGSGSGSGFGESDVDELVEDGGTEFEFDSVFNMTGPWFSQSAEDQIFARLMVTVPVLLSMAATLNYLMVWAFTRLVARTEKAAFMRKFGIFIV